MVYKSSSPESSGGAGTVTQIDTGVGLTGGPITTSGTISIEDGDPNSLAGFDDNGVFAGVEVGTGLDLTDGLLTATETGGVNEVTADDTSLTILPNTGSVFASLNVANANIWTGKQTFNTSAPRIGTVTTNTALVADGSKDVISSVTTLTELSYSSGVTSPIQTQLNGKQATGNYITALTGDITAAGPGSVAATLATVNSNVGSFGSSTSIPTLILNAKGLVTGASGNAVVAPAGTLTGTALASNVVISSLTSVGTLVGGATGTGFTIALGSSTITGALPVANAGAPSSGSTGQVLTKNSNTDYDYGWATPTTGTVTAVSIVSANGFAGSSGGGATPALTLSTTITGILSGNGTAISAASTTGSGAVVLATSPTLVTPALGTPTALVGTNISGTAANLTAGAVTNATLTTVLTVNTGTVTLVGNVANTSVLTIGAGAVSVSGANTGDQTNITGNAGTATALQNARTIGGTSFNGTANITVATATGGFTVSGGDLALGANNLTMTGSLGATGARLTKGWFTDLQVTNAIAGSITGNAATVTTNANLTGPITSSGNATSIASQTGTGTKFVVDTSPTLITPNIGVAAGTSLDVSGVLESGVNSATGGQLKMFGSTSGDVTLKVAAAAGTATVFQLPATNGSNTNILQTDGAGVTSWVASPAAGANTALSNLASVAINTSLLPGSDDGAALGSTTKEFSDLFLASGGVINWAAGNATITHSTNKLSHTGASTGYTFDNPVAISAGTTSPLVVNGTPKFQLMGTDIPTSTMMIACFDATVSEAGDFRFYRSKNAAIGSATVVANGDNLGSITWYGAQQTGTFSNTNTAAQIRCVVGGTVTSGAGADMPGKLIFSITPDGSGTVTDQLTLFANGDAQLATTGSNAASIVIVGGTQTLTNKTLTSPTMTAPVLGAASATSITFTSTTGIIGTTTNDSAAAGSVGEIIESTVLVGAAVSMTSPNAANVTSISLTAGDWDVWGNVATSANALTTTTLLASWISTTSATVPTIPNSGAYTQYQSAVPAGGAIVVSAGSRILKLSGTTTVYLSALAVFATNTLSTYGYIGARRRR